MVAHYDGKVKVVYKNFLIHPEVVEDAHLAGCAAQEQGKFMPFYHAFWDKAFGAYSTSRDASKLGEENILLIAAEAGLDASRLKTQMASPECAALLKSDMNDLRTFGVSGTPAFFINGKFTMFSSPAEFAKLIDSELKIAQDSGVPASEYYAQEVLGKGLKTFRSMKDVNDEAAAKP